MATINLSAPRWTLHSTTYVKHAINAHRRVRSQVSISTDRHKFTVHAAAWSPLGPLFLLLILKIYIHMVVCLFVFFSPLQMYFITKSIDFLIVQFLQMMSWSQVVNINSLSLLLCASVSGPLTGKSIQSPTQLRSISVTAPFLFKHSYVYDSQGYVSTFQQYTEAMGL